MEELQRLTALIGAVRVALVVSVAALVVAGARVAWDRMVG